MFHLWNVSHKGVSFLPNTSNNGIECRLLIYTIASKELLCNITQHLRIDTRLHSIIITKSGQARGYECLKMTHLSSSLSNRTSREWFIKVLQTEVPVTDQASQNRTSGTCSSKSYDQRV